MYVNAQLLLYIPSLNTFRIKLRKESLYLYMGNKTQCNSNCKRAQLGVESSPYSDNQPIARDTDSAISAVNNRRSRPLTILPVIMNVKYIGSIKSAATENTEGSRMSPPLDFTVTSRSKSLQKRKTSIVTI